VVFVTGATPGVGKTTLSRRLAAAAATSRVVALFAEADILEREEFLEVVASFRATGMASTDQLLAAARRYVQTCLVSDVDMVVQDMLFPFLPSLLAWGLNDREISSFFAALAESCDGVELTQVHVLGDPAVSIPRAVRREHDDWLAWLISKVDSYADAGADVRDIYSLIRYFERAEQRTRQLLTSAPWRVVFVDSALGAKTIATQAIDALGLAAATA
jgi:hypothetical protein